MSYKESLIQYITDNEGSVAVSPTHVLVPQRMTVEEVDVHLKQTITSLDYGSKTET